MYHEARVSRKERAIGESVVDYGEHEYGFVKAVMMHHANEYALLRARRELVEQEANVARYWVRSLGAQERTAERTLELGRWQTTLRRYIGASAGLKIKMNILWAICEQDTREHYRAMRAIERVRDAYVERDMVHILTEPLYGFDRGVMERGSLVRRWRRIGPYDIRWPVNNPHPSTIHWINLDGRKYYTYLDRTQYWHGPNNIGPHGFVECMGPTSQTVWKACKARDWTLLVKILVRYAECPGTGLVDTLAKWPAVEENEVPLWYLKTEFQQPPALDTPNFAVVRP